MDRNYMIFIIGYDFAKHFESMELTCDEAFAMTTKIVDSYISETAIEDIHYQNFYDYVENLMAMGGK